MTTTLPITKNFSPLAPIDSVDAFIQQAYKIPVLTADEEHSLALRLRDNDDLDAAKQLILSHLRFVIRVARGYQGYGLSLADLIQEGNIGLMKAVKRFDPDHGVRLVSFAVHWIKAEIHEFVIRNWRIVKIATTKAQRKLFFNLRSMKKRLGWFSKEEVEGVAEDLGVKPKEVLEMESRLNAHDMSFDLSDDDDEDNTYSPSLFLEAANADPARLIEANDSEKNQTNVLQTAMSELDARSRDIISQRWLADKKSTLHDLADQYSVSAERVRQLEANAMKKLKVAMVA
tara:strand:+ start:84 stop:944 length:861 start_codon:yes stop_codon:yes gene_type:complete